MNTDEYERLAMRTEADQDKILVRLMAHGANAMRLDNAARGLAADAGEVCTAVMRHVEYGKPLDVANLKEEAGDCLWRLAQLCKAAGFSLADAMAANIRKLRVRYPDHYTDELAAEEHRDRKAEAEAVGGTYNATTLPLSEWAGRKPGEEARPLPKRSAPAVVQDGHGFGHTVIPGQEGDLGGDPGRG